MDELEKDRNEIHFNQLGQEVFIRLKNQGILANITDEKFIAFFEEAQFRAERSVQYVNSTIRETLFDFKKNGGKLYLVSDFYGSKI